MKINRDSWHYRFAAWGTDEAILRNRDDFCSYVSAFGKACIGALIILTLGAGLLGITGDFIGWLVACIVAHAWITPFLAAAFMALLVVALIVLSAAYLMEGDSSAPLRAAIAARRDKFCPTVEFD